MAISSPPESRSGGPGSATAVPREILAALHAAEARFATVVPLYAAVARKP